MTEEATQLRYRDHVVCPALASYSTYTERGFVLQCKRMVELALQQLQQLMRPVLTTHRQPACTSLLQR